MILLVRVDERLIHGQVTVAWRGALDLDAFAVVDDELAGSDWEKDLVLAAAPEGTVAEVVTVADAVRLWNDWKADTRRRMVLVQSFASARSICASGVDLGSLNVGGLHKREGRKEFLPYVWLDSAEMETCRYLCRSGVTLEARNVPATSGVNLCARIGDS
ncbi:MAG TPA: PTS sugar transporter subunit IIB [Candidatus Latescibacteria bacterium]|nr:PTS sugar transporter subunit IIB [Candidatus Latescibacterota bacterium]